MSKPRVILADNDTTYAVSFQARIIETFGRSIDLEVITDSAYFTNLFSVPQTADILIVAESMLSQGIFRHSIANIYCMTERHPDHEENVQQFVYLFKYSNFRDIIHAIVDSSGQILKIDGSNLSSPKILLVCSAAGGVGKTTVSLGICSALGKSFRKVLYINASSLQSFQHQIPDCQPICSQSIYTRLIIHAENPYSELRSEICSCGFRYLPPFHAPLMALGLDADIYRKIAASARDSGEYDFIVIDSDYRFDEAQAKLMELADNVMIITQKTAAAICATNLLSAQISGIKSEKYFFLCNQYNAKLDNLHVSKTIQENYSVTDYIDFLPTCEQMLPADLGSHHSIKQAAFLII